ncbi:MAG: hypothetical protein Faunusvirus44_5 [Faunusvirus sp.]|uniref:Uncharacterized protein n=1 Tax=Faunusvirus sp. TaxID=2487766 RepID=A0A3G4ZXU4_9VIRU|nr:MAG: hypothetical protein Faunusvirus44_5 [Faunusvirus sp.]
MTFDISVRLIGFDTRIIVRITHTHRYHASDIKCG